MTAWRFLPEGTDALGPNERLLWRGRPGVRGLARDLFHLRLWIGYFALLAGWNLATAHHDGLRARDAAAGSLLTFAACLAVVALIYGGAWAIATTTDYLLTDKRVIMRIGVAFPISLSLPLHSIGSADLRMRSGGSGDIAFAFSGDDRLAFLLLWPHVRPGRFRQAQPMLRAVAEAEAAAALIARALVAVSPEGATAPLLEKAVPGPFGLDTAILAGDRLARSAQRNLEGRLA